MTLPYEKEIESRLRAVDWASFSTAHGDAGSVPLWLWDLRFGTPNQSEEAVDALWSSLCHQKGHLASAAVQALPFLVEFLPQVSEPLRADILDILDGFAVCSAPSRGYPAGGHHAVVRDLLRRAIKAIGAYREAESSDVREFANRILNELSEQDQREPQEEATRPSVRQGDPTLDKPGE